MSAALDRDWVPGDVDGDGRSDRVAVAVDESTDPVCRAFVAVRLAGSGTTYSAVLDASAVPPAGMTGQVIGLPDLGDDPGAEVVVDTQSMADGALAQMFTLTRSGLVRWASPAFEDGNFVVQGVGVTEPRGAACTADGSLVLSMALLERDRYEVTRHADQLGEQFPEFNSPHFAACGDRVDTGD